MIYVIESKGKGQGKADTVMLRTFLSMQEFHKYAETKEMKQSDGHKYWTRFDIVEPGEEIENYSE